MSDFSPGQSDKKDGEGNLPILSVGEISQAIKGALERGFERVRVRGEISRPSFPASGHCYLRLKDADAVLDGVIWRGVLGRLGLRPEEGLEVICTGRITAYPGRSSYQIVVEQMELAGEGALLKLLEERKRKLAAEGLFAAERKRPLPYLPEVVGVVTSPTGAVIRDILHRLSDRFPRHVLVWPVLVQGEGAAEQIARAIEGFNALPQKGPLPRPDVLIVARGGGSLEDLWAFNEEVVVRAAAASKIPLISAVGHETDTTLIDFASDRRAPTPTAAAEMAVPVRGELMADLADLAGRLIAGGGRHLAERRREVEGLARGLPQPRRVLEDKTQALDERVIRFERAWLGFSEVKRAMLAELSARLPHPQRQVAWSGERVLDLSQRLAALSPRLARAQSEALARLDPGRRLRAARDRLLSDSEIKLVNLGRILETTSHRRILARGFALVHGMDGLLTRAAAVKPGAALELEFADGRAAAMATGTAAPQKKEKHTKRTAKPGKDKSSRQGKLL